MPLKETDIAMTYAPIVYIIDHLFQYFAWHAKQGEKSIICHICFVNFFENRLSLANFQLLNIALFPILYL